MSLKRFAVGEPTSKQQIIEDLKRQLKEILKNEKLDAMEAIAGHNMIETVTGEDDREVKIMYLTNHQAAKVAKDKNGLNLMIDTLCSGNKKPNLIIDLAHSWGFKKSTELYPSGGFESKYTAGMKHGERTFLTFSDEFKGHSQLDHFMEKAIIPLAEETSALVFCHAHTSDCVLSDSFTRIVEQMSARWGGEPPFTLVGIVGQVDCLYRNKAKENTRWMKMSKECTRWEKRSNFLNLYYEYKDTGKESQERYHDLSWLTRRILIVEGLNIDLLRKEVDVDGGDNVNPKNRAPFSTLINSIVSSISKTANSITIKAGSTPRSFSSIQYPTGVEPMGLQWLLERTNANTKVLCLDMRDERDYDMTNIKTNRNRKKTIKEKIEKGFNLGVKMNETLDISMLAYLKKLLVDAAAAAETKNQENKGLETLSKRINRLEESITRSQVYEDKHEENEQEAIYENEQEAIYYANMFTEVFFRNVMQLWQPYMEKIGQGKAQKEKNNAGQQENAQAAEPEENDASPSCDGEPDLDDHSDDHLDEFFGEEIMTIAALVRKLLLSPIFYSVNIWENDPKSIVEKIVLADCRPREPSLQCLKVLENAWDAINITTEAADWYRKFYRLTYLAQLILAFLVTLFSVIGSNWAKDSHERSIYQHLTVLCSLLLSAVVSINTYVKPRLNWQTLRSEAVDLESIIWKFRMRVGEFEEDTRNRHRSRPEENLSLEFHSWRQNSMAGANKNAPSVLTSLFRTYGDEKMKIDFKSRKIEESGDNHYSSIDGNKFAQYRVCELINLYEQKISENKWSRIGPQMLIVSGGVIIALCSELGFPAVVTILVALLSSYNLWLESTGFFEKYYLYSSAIAACKVEESKWHANSNFKKQNKNVLQEFVTEIENIVLQVISSWSTTMATKKSTVSSEHTSGRDSFEGPIIKSKVSVSPSEKAMEKV